MRGRDRTFAMTLSVAVLLLTGCRIPGRPGPEPDVPRPDEVHAFATLYAQNCAGCHGATGRDGSATELANPEYQAWVDDASLREVIEQGETGSLMPAFGIEHGGTLTEAQVDVLVHGVRAQWARADAFAGALPPAYHAASEGSASQGAAVYASACARCHGATAEQPGPAGSILDASFLTLVNAQTLRTTIVAGRTDIGQPDWRGEIAGRALTEAEVRDVTAWLLAQAPEPPSGSGGNTQASTSRAAAMPSRDQKQAQ